MDNKYTRLSYIKNLVDSLYNLRVDDDTALVWIANAAAGVTSDDMPLFIDRKPHKRGDEQCAQCWNKAPDRHSCGGLMHYDMVDLGPTFAYECDKCGSTDGD